MKSPLDLSRFRFWTLVGIIIPLFAGLVTFATGYLSSYSLTGGFPFAWKQVLFISCGIPTCRSILMIICRTCGATWVRYNWPSFALDIIFYTAVGYSDSRHLSWEQALEELPWDGKKSPSRLRCNRLIVK